ncbi:MAG: hypothetical protein K0U52_05885 [Gammaproteobacteria bacterium]|jgi:hypothetical protein|nr:hypothetical protein [Gammaproteobacteria bacterium]
MGQFGNQPDFGTEAATVAASDTISPATNLTGSVLYIGTGGSVKVLMAGKREVGDAIIFANVPDGSFLPVTVDYVLATGTTASDIISLK